jgi:hypothetical protein
MTALLRNFDLSDAAVITGALLVVIGVALVNLAAAMIAPARARRRWRSVWRKTLKEEADMGANETAALNRSRATVVPPRPSVAALRARLERIRDEDMDRLIARAEQEIEASRRRIERLLAMPPAPRPVPSSDNAPASPWGAIHGVGELVQGA